MKRFALALCAATFASALADRTKSLLRASADEPQTPRRLEAMDFMATMTGTGPYCVSENNYDYVGSDLENKPGQLSDCCQLCFRTAGCAAWSWSNHNGGTCWLKGGRGKVVYNPNVKSGVVMYPTESSPCTKLDEDVDYVGNDVGSAPSVAAQDCCGECAKVADCHAFTHTNHNGGTCWLKSDRGRMIYKAGAKSGVAYGVTNQPTCGLEANVDYVGNDIGSAMASAPSECCAKCQAFAGCRAFSWTNQNGGTCFFKNRKDATVAKNGVTSAAVFPNPSAPSCAMQLGTDYVGNDIGNAPSADPYGCCSICMKTAGCGAFSWTNQSGGMCWLKSSKGATVANANVQSAVV